MRIGRMLNNSLKAVGVGLAAVLISGCSTVSLDEPQRLCAPGETMTSAGACAGPRVPAWAPAPAAPPAPAPDNAAPVQTAPVDLSGEPAQPAAQGAQAAQANQAAPSVLATPSATGTI